MALFNLIPLEERIVLDAAAAAVIYVDVHASGANNGSSWANAYSDLQGALNKAASTAGPDQIWIADGVYKPSQIYSPNGVTGGASGLNDAHLKTFNLPDNVKLYGGFKGNENSLSKRNPVSNITVLSGDLLGNDINNVNASGYLVSKADNAWHVVTAGNDIAQTGVHATLDGLTITNGFAAGPTPTPANPGNFQTFAYSHESGGGVYVRWGSQITLKNDILTNNAAGYFNQDIIYPPLGGGAIYAMDPGTVLNVDSSLLSYNNANPALHRAGGAINTNLGVILNLTNSQLIGNTAVQYGGAVAVFLAGETTISHSIFTGNSVTDAIDSHEALGGAIFIENAVAGATITIDSSLFTNNSTNHAVLNVGGAIAVERGNMDNVESLNVVISNSIFVNNRSVSGGAVCAFDITGQTGTFLSFVNDTFIGNHAAGGGALNLSVDAQIDNSNFIGNSASWAGGAILNQNVLPTLFDFFGIPVDFSTLTINNSNFIGNSVNATAAGFSEFSAAYNGVGVFVLLPGVNGSTGGGAIRNDTGATLVVDNSTFISNSTQNAGGGATDGGAIQNADPTIEAFGFLLTSPSIAQISNSRFVANRTSGNGGAIASEDNNSLSPLIFASITNNTFVANRADQNGGALYLKTTLATVTGNTFYNSNDSDLNGDQIYASNSVVNGIPSSSSAALKANLKATNTFKQLDSDDIYLV